MVGTFSSSRYYIIILYFSVIRRAKVAKILHFGKRPRVSGLLHLAAGGNVGGRGDDAQASISVFGREYHALALDAL